MSVEVARRWQRKNIADGRCLKCPSLRINSQHCQRHADYQRDLMRAKRRDGQHCRDCARRLSTSEINKLYTRCQKCVAASASYRKERDAKIIKLREDGLSTTEISRLVGIGLTRVRNVIAGTPPVSSVRDDWDEREPQPERCPRCSLALPHYNCLAPAWAVAQRRHGEATGL